MPLVLPIAFYLLVSGHAAPPRSVFTSASSTQLTTPPEAAKPPSSVRFWASPPFHQARFGLSRRGRNPARQISRSGVGWRLGRRGLGARRAVWLRCLGKRRPHSSKPAGRRPISGLAVSLRPRVASSRATGHTSASEPQRQLAAGPLGRRRPGTWDRVWRAPASTA